MKRQFFLLILAGALIMGCNSTPNFSSVTKKDWKLVKAQINGREVRLDRKALASENAGNNFTLKFDGGSISGTGTANTCSASYTAGNNQKISIRSIRTTTVPTRQPEKIWEQKFFLYLQNAYEWTMVNKNLEIHSKTEDGDEVKLEFSL
jgi:heat shock protein HslJ